MAIGARAVASLPTRLGAQVWQADRFVSGKVPAHPSRFAALDAELPGGGWPLGMLTELIARDPGIGELRLLIPLVRQLTIERRIVILLAPPLVPYAPALAAFGVDLDYLIVIHAPHAADRLWAVEQTLKSTSFGALLAWLPQHRTRPEHLRRMQLAAQTCRGPVLLFRQLPAQFESSPAPLRLLLLPRPGQQLSVQVLKRRGPLLADPIVIPLPQPPLSLDLRSRAAGIDGIADTCPTGGNRTDHEVGRETIHVDGADDHEARADDGRVLDRDGRGKGGIHRDGEDRTDRRDCDSMTMQRVPAPITLPH
jgi:cell division inhibitor SulA